MAQMLASVGPSLTPIERLRCPRCTCRPGLIGFEHRLFERPKFDFVQGEIIVSDPMKSNAVGWLSGELHPPS